MTLLYEYWARIGVGATMKAYYRYTRALGSYTWDWALESRVR